MDGRAPHVPVLADEAIGYLVPEPGTRDGTDGGVVVDATLGAGGHAERILDAMGPSGRVLGIDRDDVALAIARERLARFGDRVRFERGNFDDLEYIVRASGWDPVAGVLYDLGVSSMHFDDPARGFSYQHDAPLDMRMDRSQDRTAADVVNTYDQRDLTRILRTYGEERWASRIAQFVVRARRRKPLSTTVELVELIRDAVPHAARRVGPHPARRTFQALRIEVNGELDALSSSLPQAVATLGVGGRLVAISYHSLEDRIVKRFMVAEARGEVPRLRLLTRRPETAGEAEVTINPRASAAKLRAAERLASPPGGWTPPEGSAA
ncbi:MAG: 16S rRNA (cytosine(1402)-N(4))-methyltransferase RsmH [Actinobacteria bacterium]|nr:MAG: 16S rRNA (cytosine(1402)-N(4))-methyltransferase RsmH [Actinomycetota bacterium]